MLCPGFLLQVKVVWHCLAVHWSFLEDSLSQSGRFTVTDGKWVVTLKLQVRGQSHCWASAGRHCSLVSDHLWLSYSQARQAFKSEPELPTCQPEPDKQGKLRVQIVQADCVCSMPTRNATNVFHQLTREFFQRVHFKPYWGWHSLHLDQRNCDLTSTTCSCCSADQKFGFRCWTQVTQGLAIEALFIDWCYKHCTNICLQGREKHGFKTDESLMIVKNGYLNYCWAIRPQQCGPKIM